MIRLAYPWFLCLLLVIVPIFIWGQKRGGKVLLIPENRKYKPIDVTNRQDFAIWGVVTSVIHRV